jgi:hypothetical protein
MTRVHVDGELSAHVLRDLACSFARDRDEVSEPVLQQLFDLRGPRFVALRDLEDVESADQGAHLVRVAVVVDVRFALGAVAIVRAVLAVENVAARVAHDMTLHVRAPACPARRT